MRDVAQDIFNHDELRRIKSETQDAPLALEYRTQPTKPDEDSTATTTALAAVSCSAVAIVLLINILGPFLLSPWFLAAFASLGVLFGLFAAIGGAGLRLAVLSLAFVTLAPIALWPFYQATQSSVVMTLFGVFATVATSFLLDRFASHYVAWLTANPRLRPTARDDLRAAWAKRFKFAITGSASASRLLPAYPLFLVAPAVLVVFAYAATLPRAVLLSDSRFPAIRPFAVFTLAFLLLLVVAAVALVLVRGRATLSVFLEGLRSWMNYGSRHLPAPGLFQSPAGSQLRRLILTGTVLSSLAFVILPASGFFSVLLEASPQPWADWLYGQDHHEHIQPAGRFTISRLYLARVNPQFLADSNPTEVAKSMVAYFTTSSTAWVPLACDGAVAGYPFFAWSLIVGFVLSFVAPIAVLLAMLMITTAAFVVPIQRSCSKGSPALEPDTVTDWNCFATRLQHSPNELESDHLWLGVHVEDDYPVFLHREILREHAYIVGDTGSGKTALGVTPLLVQLIRRRDAGIVILDLKGDPALFHAAREEARDAGIEFKFFTNELGRPTYTFNPFLQSGFETLTFNQICEGLLEALNLNHGEGYGRSYYSRVARSWLHRTLSNHPHIRSFTELHEIAMHADNFRDRKKERQDVFELLSVLETLASIDQLNITARRRKKGADYPASVRENAIYMPDVVTKNQVVYFWLPAIVETASVREISKLALYALIQAARQHTLSAGRPRQCYLFIDEFQRIASNNFRIVLEQARSFGVGVILSNQTVADLKTEDVDLRPAVKTNTRLKQCFSAVDAEQQEALMVASGEKLDTLMSMSQETHPKQTEIRTLSNPGIARTTITHGIRTTVSLSEFISPRIQRNDVIRGSDGRLQSIVQIHRGSGYTQLSGFSVPLTTDYVVTKATHNRRTYKEPWPAHVEGVTIPNQRPPLEEFETLESRVEAGKQAASTVAAVAVDEQCDEDLEALRQYRMKSLEQHRWRAAPGKQPATEQE